MGFRALGINAEVKLQNKAVLVQGTTGLGAKRVHWQLEER